MTARIPIVAIGALIMAGSLINCLSQDKYHTTRCLRVCGLNERKTLTKSAQAFQSLSCYHCLRRRRDVGGHVSTVERHKRSIFARDCGDTASNGTLLPEQQLTSSRPNVTFGQYEKTVNWYANVSWNPVKDPDGVLKGYLVNLGFGSRLGILCSVLPKNQTYLSINISHYGYTYPENIYLLIQSIPSNVSDHEMESFVNDVRIPTSTSPSTPRTTMAETTAKTTVETSTAAKAPTRETTSKGATKTIQYVFISVGLAATVIRLAMMSYVLLRKFLLWRSGAKDQGSGDDENMLAENIGSD
nr:uncharacterized protein LOC131778856 [Pocillopora verrucosa]